MNAATLKQANRRAPQVAENSPPAPFVAPWKGLHHNSKAYAEKFAKFLRQTCQDEATAAYWYRAIRNKEIPAKPAASYQLATV